MSYTDNNTYFVEYLLHHPFSKLPVLFRTDMEAKIEDSPNQTTLTLCAEKESVHEESDLPCIC